MLWFVYEQERQRFDRRLANVKPVNYHVHQSSAPLESLRGSKLSCDTLAFTFRK